MAHGFVIEQLWRFSCPEECHGFPSYGHRYYPAQSPPAPGVSMKVIWCAPIALGPNLHLIYVLLDHQSR